MAIGFSPPHSERMFHCLDYSNPEAVQGMLRNYHKFYTIAEERSNTEIMCIYCDITNALQDAQLTERQVLIVSLYINGWNLVQIAEKLNINETSVHNLIRRICRRIGKYLERKD